MVGLIVIDTVMKTREAEEIIGSGTTLCGCAFQLNVTQWLVAGYYVDDDDDVLLRA